MVYRPTIPLLCVLLVACLSTDAQDKAADVWQPNFIRNADFEDGLRSWRFAERRGTARFGTTITDKAHGKASAYLDAGENGTVSLVQSIRVREGGTYRFAGSARSDGGSTYAGIRLRCLDHNGTRLRDVWAVHLPAWRVPWRRYEEQIDVPGPTSTIEIQLTVRGGGRAQFDHLYLGRRKPYPEPDKLLADRGWAFVSDLAFTNERGTVTRDAQTRRWRAKEPLRLDNTIYDKGIGICANGSVVIHLAGEADIFRATVGVDDEAAKGSVRCSVYGDKKLLLETDVMRCGDQPKAIDVDVRGVTELQLVVDDAGDSRTDDDADWCDAVLLKEDAVPPPTSGRKIARPIAGIRIDRLKTPRPVWALAVSDLDGNGEEELILGGQDGMVSAAEMDGEALWQNHVGGIPLAIDAGDVDGDGRRETAVCSLDVDGGLHLIGFDGKTLWSFSIPGLFFTALDVADLDNDGKAEVIAASGNRVLVVDAGANLLWAKDFGAPLIGSVAAGDITGDATKEIVIGFKAQWMRAAALSAAGEVLWTFSPTGMRGTMDLASLRIADINSDGRQDLVFGASPQTILAVDGDGNLLWKKEKIGMRQGGEPSRSGNVHVEVADFWPDLAGLETMVLSTHSIRMLDRDGNEVWQSDSRLQLLGSSLTRGRLGAMPNVYIPSSGPRDTAAYRLTLEAGAENQLAEYALADPIGDNLDALRARLPTAPALPPHPQAKKPDRFHIVTSVPAEAKAAAAAYEYLRSRESENLEYLPAMQVRELPVSGAPGRPLSQEKILTLAQHCETEGIPFFLTVCRAAVPWITQETAKAILEKAPTCCRGFVVEANCPAYPSKKWTDFVDWVLPLMDLCASHEKRVLFCEPYDCWAFLPSDPQVFEKLFQEKYRSVIVPVFATGGANAPDQALAGMIGLQNSGCVDSWGMATQRWSWSWANRAPIDHADVCPPDIIFRSDLAAALLGATYFYIGENEGFLGRDAKTDERASRHRDLFHEVLRQNIVVPMDPKRIATLSAASIVRQFNIAMGKQPMCGTPELRSGSLQSGFLGVRYALQTVEDDYLAAYAYGASRYLDGMFPRIRSGLIPILPVRALERCPTRPDPEILTDGDNVILGGKTLSAFHGKKEIQRILEEARGKLPFTADGCFLAVHNLGDEQRIYLMDADCLAPKDTTVQLKIRTPDKKLRLTDLVTGDEIEHGEEQVELTIPAGTFRAISARVIED